jgi:hypothetical protein
MKTKLGFIVKAKFNGQMIFNHLDSNEIHLISKIAGEADGKVIEVKKVFYQNTDQFNLMKF